MEDKLLKNEHFLDLLLVLLDLEVVEHKDITAMGANKNYNVWMTLMSRAIWQAHNRGFEDFGEES